LLNAALHAFHASAHSIDAAPVIDLREENLKLREENLKLRERIFELEQMLASPRANASTASKSTLVEVK
jgi:cell division septum initiation protein DivIVA